MGSLKRKIPCNDDVAGTLLLPGIIFLFFSFFMYNVPQMNNFQEGILS